MSMVVVGWGWKLKKYLLPKVYFASTLLHYIVYHNIKKNNSHKPMFLLMKKLPASLYVIRVAGLVFFYQIIWLFLYYHISIILKVSLIVDCILSNIY